MNVTHYFMAFIALFTVSRCIDGFEFSIPYPYSQLAGLANNGYKKMIMRGYSPYGSVDPNAQAALRDINTLIESTDISMYPCRGKNAKTQVDQIFSQIPANLYKTVWVKVVNNTVKDCGWDGFHWTTNCQYITNIVNRIKQFGKQVGIYTSLQLWVQIMGGRSKCAEVAKKAQLWYVHNDGKYSFSDWTPFGGWSKPAMKQLKGEGRFGSPVSPYLFDGLEYFE